jgi:hypothetical protein
MQFRAVKKSILLESYGSMCLSLQDSQLTLENESFSISKEAR